jgi:hypothetical protein
MTDVSAGPPEPPDGQESDPPDEKLALAVTITLLTDVEPVLRERDPELVLRLIAIRQVLRRLRKHLDGGDW